MTSEEETAVEKQVRAFVSLCRYRTWSTTLRAVAVPAQSELEERKEHLLVPTVALLSYWFVSLRVLSDGWQQLGLGDPTIDELLASPHLALLQRYRNGVCHYQRDFADARFADLVADSASIAWIKKLDLAFETYFEPHRPKPNVRLIEDWVRS